ncbi:thermonuclease family protein [Klebsiella pneumoniae]
MKIQPATGSFARNLIYSTKPIQDHGQDVYGRMLGTIYLNNNDVNAIMVANGMAWAYRYQGRLIVPEYGPLEQNAALLNKSNFC